MRAFRHHESQPAQWTSERRALRRRPGVGLDYDFDARNPKPTTGFSLPNTLPLKNMPVITFGEDEQGETILHRTSRMI